MSVETTIRQQVRESRRIVVKIGSRVLVQENGAPNLDRMTMIVDAVADLRRLGKEVIIVTSGAVGAGLEALNLTVRPDTVPALQMAAAVGQPRLMTRYEQLFAERQCRIGQVLLTHGDLKDRTRHLNARNTMMNLLRHGIVPVVNENDVVSVEEITFGDNDMLASLVAVLTQADLLILLTTTDGVHDRMGDGASQRLSYVASVDEAILQHVRDEDNQFSTGGMASKLKSAQSAVDMGIPAVIADGRVAGVLQSILDGESVGTLLADDRPVAVKKLSGRKKWIALFHKPEGILAVDDGAERALMEEGKSLLPIGISRVEGDFQMGAVVDIHNGSGVTIARGLVDYASEQIRCIMGHKTTEIDRLLGRKDYDEVIHRDNLVVLQK